MGEGMKNFPDAEVVATEADVQRAYERLAAALQPVIFAEECVLLGVLMGGLLPMARLSGMLGGDFEMDYCQVSRYRGGTRGGEFLFRGGIHHLPAARG